MDTKTHPFFWGFLIFLGSQIKYFPKFKDKFYNLKN